LRDALSGGSRPQPLSSGSWLLAPGKVSERASSCARRCRARRRAPRRAARSSP
jgi:hypothetical protein